METNNRPMRRAEASAYLHERHQIQHSPDYLAKLAVTGKGPRFDKIKRTPVYRPEYLDEYAAAVTSPPVRSTSELHAGTSPTETK